MQETTMITVTSFKELRLLHTRIKLIKTFESIKKKYQKTSTEGFKIIKNRFVGKDELSLKSWGIKNYKNKEITLSNFKKKIIGIIIIQ